MAKTIAAIATPAAAGGISVVRISGEDAIPVADRVFRSRSGELLKEKKGYTASFGAVWNHGEELDTSVALVFRGPKSYTGEDVVELSCHGGIFVTREVLRAVLENGAVLAEAGEFTKRAFLNGKMSLTQAEAVADLISARNGQALKAARSQMDGALYRKIAGVQQELLDLAGHLGAWVDYPEEDITEIENSALEGSLSRCLEVMDGLLSSFDTGKMLREGIPTVIAGKPNVGKSTLMNLLSGCRRSIVTEIAGTTRDVVEETVSLGDVILRLSDTAGIRETDDPVERMGVELAREKLENAALILAVFDSSAPLDGEDERLMDELAGKPVIALVNKADLEPRLELDRLRERFDSLLVLSALDEGSLSHLEKAVREKTGLLELDPSAAMLANERQREKAAAARNGIEEALSSLRAGYTLDAVTVSVDAAIDALLELSGGRVTEEVVNQVFSHFCVGK